MSLQSRLTSTAAAAAVALSLLALGAPMSSAAPPEHASRHIVVLRDGAGDPASVAAEHGNRYGAKVDFVYRNALKGTRGRFPTPACASSAATIACCSSPTTGRSPSTPGPRPPASSRSPA